MPVIRKPLDITKLKADAIVNSLGYDTNVYGAICAAIVKAANSDELVKQISSWKDDGENGKIYETPGYSLSSKHILHVKTPFFKYDHDMYDLERTYRDILLYAYEHKYYNLGLPIIGTGANGYPHAYVLKMVMLMTEAFSDLHKEMRITICNPVKTLEDYHNDYDLTKLESSLRQYLVENDIEIDNDFEYDDEFFGRKTLCIANYSKYKDEASRFTNEQRRGKPVYSFLDEDDISILEKGERPVKFDCTKLSSMSVQHYLDKYLQVRYKNEEDRKIAYRLMKENAVYYKENANAFYSKLKGKRARETITTDKIVRYSLALHMNLEETNDFLAFCGRCFSPVDEKDKILKSFIMDKVYDHDKINGFLWNHGQKYLYEYKERDY